MSKIKILLVSLSLILVSILSFSACGPEISGSTTNTGVSKASVGALKTTQEGLTIEQQNIRDRLLNDNQIGAIKHLYIISAYSGDVILYSTVRGKVTSSGKRLEPYTSTGTCGEYCPSSYSTVIVNGETFLTAEIMQDDGTYGSSEPYVYWWDTKGIYHQHYVSGGQIIHISDQPLAVKKIIINISNPE